MTDKRDHIKSIYTEAINAVSPLNALLNSLVLENNNLKVKSDSATIAEYNLEDYQNIYVVGAGKATASMAEAVEKILGDRITRGLILVKYGHTKELAHIDLLEGAHPVPDRAGLEATERIIQLLNGAGENDLVISLISGGGSALLCSPVQGVNLKDKVDTTDLLLSCGATIHEMNAVRKHLSTVKGGGGAVVAFPATVINFMISDVVGDHMDVIASGPFVADRSIFKDAYGVFEKYNLLDRLPEAVLEHITRGLNGERKETPTPDNQSFKRVFNHIIASNIVALKAAKKRAEALGYNTIILSSMIEGDVNQSAKFHISIAKEIIMSHNPVDIPACIISGGESTVEIKGTGLGGRNMEFAMDCAELIDGEPMIMVASVGTDGNDGPTDSAGAVVDGETLSICRDRNLNFEGYKLNNDSYNLFKSLDQLIITGPTLTNVMDLRIILVK